MINKLILYVLFESSPNIKEKYSDLSNRGINTTKFNLLTWVQK